MASKNDSSSDASEAAQSEPQQVQPQKDTRPLDNRTATFTDKDRKDGYILVKLGAKAKVQTGANKFAHVLFHEFDDRHPRETDNGSEVLVVHGKTVKAFPTTGVRRAIATELLEEVDSGAGVVHDEPPMLSEVLDKQQQQQQQQTQATATPDASGL